jgi:hypothetical protein
MLMFAALILAVILPTSTPAASPPAPLVAAASRPSAQPLAPVVINGVLFRGVEFDTGKAVWRNLAITVTSDHLDDWRGLPAAIKGSYAEQMIDCYRTGTKYGRDIKLTFVDERNATLDQYLWTPPTGGRNDSK